MQKLYNDVESLYRLGQGSDASFGKKELGAMPRASVILLSTLAVTWILILLYVGKEYVKNKKKYFSAPIRKIASDGIFLRMGPLFAKSLDLSYVSGIMELFGV